jgi:hypothetical protein
MAIQFVVETGTGLSDSTAYMAVDELKQYWDNIGYSYTSITDDSIMQYINRCSKIIDNIYIKDFRGVRLKQEQSLEWPRIGAYYADGWWISSSTIPQEIKNAVAEMVYAITADGASLQPIITTKNAIIEEFVKVDVIEERRKYAEPIISKDRVTAVDDALKRLIPYVGSMGGLPIRI